MRLHPIMKQALAPFAPPEPRQVTTLAALSAHAYAASLRLSDAYREGKPEEEVARLEQLDFDARRAVRGKLAEMGVDPAMLRVVLQ